MKIFDKLKILHRDNLDVLCILLNNDSYQVHFIDFQIEEVTIFQDIYYEIKSIDKEYIINPKFINETGIYKYRTYLRPGGSSRLYGIVHSDMNKNHDIILLDNVLPLRRSTLVQFELDLIQTNFNIIDSL